MNYGNLLAGGKLVGLKIFITNLTKFEQIIELSVDAQSFRYSRDELVKDYPTEEE
jgi:pantothenate kinase